MDMSLFNIEIDSTSGKLKVVAPKIDIPTPPPLPPKKKFRIAVCFSGQPRYWQESLANIKRFFEHQYPHPENGLEVETDYFIHTWDTNSWRLPKTDISVYNDVVHNDDEDIKNAYNPKTIIVEKYVKETVSPSFEFIMSNHTRNQRSNLKPTDELREFYYKWVDPSYKVISTLI